jgi:hypothetical protein
MLWWLLLAYAVVSPAVALLIGPAIRMRDRTEVRTRVAKLPEPAPCPALIRAGEAVAVGAGR